MKLLAHIQAFAKRRSKLLNRLWIAAIILFVGYKLHQIGWRDVLGSVPAHPLFYLSYALSFLILPFSEKLIFALIWRSERALPLRPFIRKRSLNNSVLGYSGDAYFYLWVRGRLALPDRQILSGIKDSSLLSALVSATATIVMVGIFLATREAGVLHRLVKDNEWLVVAVLAAALAAAVGGFLFRRSLLGIDASRARRVVALHMMRLIGVQLLQVLQWWVVLPQVPIEDWLLLLTVQMLIGQLPLLPNRDLLFLAVATQLTGSVGVEQAALMGLLLAVALLKQGTNLLALALTSFGGSEEAALRKGAEAPSTEQPPRAADGPAPAA